MRRGVAFIALVLPVAIWAGIVTWAQSRASGWTPGAPELSLGIRAAIASSNYVTRYSPFAMVFGGLLWPLMLPLVARATRSAESATIRSVFNWWCISALAFGAMFVTGGVGYALHPVGDIPAALLAALAWTGMVAFLISMTAAYAVQQQRFLRHESPWSPRQALAGVLALNCVGLFALPLLALKVLRRSASDRAVEQGDEADEAFGGTNPRAASGAQPEVPPNARAG